MKDRALFLIAVFSLLLAIAQGQTVIIERVEPAADSISVVGASQDTVAGGAYSGKYLLTHKAPSTLNFSACEGCVPVGLPSGRANWQSPIVWTGSYLIADGDTILTSANPGGLITSLDFNASISGIRLTESGTNWDLPFSTKFISGNGGNRLIVGTDGKLHVPAEVDGSTTNELNTSFTRSGLNLSIVDAGGTKTAALPNMDTIFFQRKSEKRWALFGDSFSAIITSSLRFPKYVIEKLGLKGTVSYAVSGNKFSQQVTVLDNLLATDPNALDTIDFVTLLCGVNDFAQDVELGSFTDTVKQATVAGYLKYMIETIQGANPAIELYVITPPEGFSAAVGYKSVNDAGWTLEQLSYLISEICAYYAIPVINYWKASQWNDQTKGYYTSDLLHPGVDGANRMGEFVANAIMHNISDGYYPTLYDANPSIGHSPIWNGSRWETAAVPTGSGTADYVARWTPDANTLGIGKIRDNGTRVGINTAPGSSAMLGVDGYIYAGDASATAGAVVLAGRYISDSDYIYSFGTLRSTGAAYWGYGVGPDRVNANSWVSSTSINVRRNGITVGRQGTIEFFYAPLQTVAVGGSVTMSKAMDIANNGAVRVYKPSGGSYALWVDSVLYASYRVGIGTTAPTQSLDIVGGLRVRTRNISTPTRLLGVDGNGNASDAWIISTTAFLTGQAPVWSGSALVPTYVPTGTGTTGTLAYWSGTNSIASASTSAAFTFSGGALGLANSGVTAGTYNYATITVGADGRVTSASSGAAPTGTVTSVGLSLPAIFTVSGSPVTTSGTLTATLASQSARSFFAAPTASAGAPTFRTIVAGDLSGTGTPSGSTFLRGDMVWASAPDPSMTNEGSLTVGAGGSNSSTIVSNTSGSTAVTISGASPILVTENTGTGTINLSWAGGPYLNFTTGATPGFDLTSDSGNKILFAGARGLTVSGAAGPTIGTITYSLPSATAGNFLKYNGTDWSGNAIGPGDLGSGVASNYVLKYNGASMVWAPDESGPWQISGSNIYTSGGSEVIVDASTPQDGAKFTVVGEGGGAWITAFKSTGTSHTIYNYASSGGAAIYFNNASNSNYGFLDFQSSGSGVGTSTWQVASAAVLIATESSGKNYMTIPTGTSDPTGGFLPLIYFNTSTGQWRRYNPNTATYSNW